MCAKCKLDLADCECACDVTDVTLLVPGKKYHIRGEDCCLAFDVVATFVSATEYETQWDIGMLSGFNCSFGDA